MKPKLFIGSSIESRPAAETVKVSLSAWCDAEVWTEGFFQPGGSTSATIERRLADYDGAIFVLSPDDLLVSRGKIGPTPRANVLFELGMFGAALGLPNCIQLVLKPEDHWKDQLAYAMGMPLPGDSSAGTPAHDPWSGRNTLEPISDLAGITYIELSAKTDYDKKGRVTFDLTAGGIRTLITAFERARSKDERLLGSTFGSPAADLRFAWSDGSAHNSPLELCTFGDRVRGRFEWRGDQRTYEISLRLEGETLLSGRWWDPHQVSYEGYVQFQVRSQPTYLLGAWLGWSSNGGVKSGPCIIAQRQNFAAATADASNVRFAHDVRRWRRKMLDVFGCDGLLWKWDR